MSPFVISLAIRLTALLIAGGLMALAVRRSTYAVRHIVVAATLACVVALPAAMLLVPEWRVAMLPSVVAPHTTIEAVVTAKPIVVAAPAGATWATGQSIRPVLVTSQLPPAAPVQISSPASNARSSIIDAALALSVPQIVLIVWLVGVFIGLAWIAIGRLGLARVRRNATPLRSYEWRTILETEAMHAGVARRVALFTSHAVSMPVTWGILSPVIVLPEAALSWTHDRKRVVIMHEMAHIARRDSATQLVATFACVAYWLHPLVLLAARRLRAECERACDERVLERGTPAADYAAHLLDVAKFSRSFGAASIVSVAMARPSQLEGRLLAVLRAEPRRARTTPRTRALAALSAAAMLLVISAFKPVVREVHARTTVRTTMTPVRARQDSTPRAVLTTTVTRETRPAAASIAAQVKSARPPRSDSTFQKSVPAKSGGVLELDLDTGGDLDIVGTDDDKVSVDGSLGGHDWRDMTVDLDTRNGVAQLTSRYVGRSDTQVFDNAFKIRVPKHFDVRIQSSGGNVSISGIDGKFTGTTAGGTIEIAHANGKANLSTGGGNVRVSNSHLDGTVTTGGGTVNLDEVTGGLVGASGSSGFMDMKKNFAFRFPQMPKMAVFPKMSAMPKIAKMPSIAYFDGTMSESMSALMRQQAAMERAQGALEQERAEMERVQAMRDDNGAKQSESAMRMNQENMQHIQEELERNRVMMDSARAMIERSIGNADTAHMSFRYKIGPMKYDMESLKYDAGSRAYSESEAEKERMAVEESMSGLQDSTRVMVIERDGGKIRVLRAPNGARLRTGGGSISVGKSGGRISAMTGGGDITFDESGAAASAITGAGDITVSAGKDKPHPVDVRSGKGNVVVSIPEGADVTLDLETAYTQNLGRHTKIEGDLPLEVTETPDWDSTHGTPRKYVRVKQKIGKGGPLIRVRTVNGDIKLIQGT